MHSETYSLPQNKTLVKGKPDTDEELPGVHRVHALVPEEETETL